MSRESLVALAVSDFVARVASTEEPVPAGGSVSALVGASSAALIALACGVLVNRGHVDAQALRERAERLQADLLALVDEDADAYNVFLEDKKDAAAIARMNDLPLQIAAACQALVALSDEVAVRIKGAITADVHASRTLAHAALAASLDLAEANVSFLRDETARERLTHRIAELRG